MKVNNDVKKAQIQNAQTSSSKTDAAKTKNLESQLKSDIFKVEKNIGDSASVDLSARAKDMKKAKEVAMGAPDVREDKIKKLREMIDAGTYNVDSKKVADKLVDDELMTSATLGD